MRFAKRIVLFLLVNMLVVFTISVLLSLFNVKPYLSPYGIHMKELVLFCLIWGMGGAFISLALSRWTAKMLLGVKTIDPNTTDPVHKGVITMVHRLAREAHLTTMPEVGIYTSPEINAFATGPTKKKSLVAVSSALLEKMDLSQREGVLAHEISHIVNGDMVTMALLQGIVNAFVLFLSRLLALVFSGFGRGEDKRGSYGSFMFFTFLFQFVFMLLGSMVVFWFSRKREFRADAGGASLAGKENMIHALEGLKRFVHQHVPAAEKPALETLKISSHTKHGLARLFASHPPLEERIEKLKGL